MSPPLPSEAKSRPPGAERAGFHRQSIGEWDFVKTVGAGSMGKVKLARNRRTGAYCAIKIVPKAVHAYLHDHPQLPDNQKELEKRQMELARAESRDRRTLREAAIGSLLQHPNICEFIDMASMTNHFYMLFEYVSGGQLLDYITSHGKLKEKQARKFARSIGSALDYLHKNSIVHRDLKIENILITDKGEIKLIDFGLSNVYSPKSKLKTFCGSLYFAAPELLWARAYIGPEVDIWSFAVVIYVLVCGQVPFDDKVVPALHAKIREGHVVYPPHLSAECVDLLKLMFVVDRTARARMPVILNHPWMCRGYDGPPPSHMPKRTPLVLPLDRSVIRGMAGFDFGSEDEIEQALATIVASEEYTLASEAWRRQHILGESIAVPERDPTEGYHPLVSIYYLVMEKRARLARRSRSRTATPEKAEQPERVAQPEIPFPQAVHTRTPGVASGAAPPRSVPFVEPVRTFPGNVPGNVQTAPQAPPVPPVRATHQPPGDAAPPHIQIELPPPTDGMQEALQQGQQPISPNRADSPGGQQRGGSPAASPGGFGFGLFRKLSTKKRSAHRTRNHYHSFSGAVQSTAQSPFADPSSPTPAEPSRRQFRPAEASPPVPDISDYIISPNFAAKANTANPNTNVKPVGNAGVSAPGGAATASVAASKPAGGAAVPTVPSGSAETALQELSIAEEPAAFGPDRDQLHFRTVSIAAPKPPRTGDGATKGHSSARAKSVGHIRRQSLNFKKTDGAGGTSGVNAYDTPRRSGMPQTAPHTASRATGRTGAEFGVERADSTGRTAPRVLVEPDTPGGFDEVDLGSGDLEGGSGSGGVSAEPMPSIEHPKQVYLKGFFSVQNTSTKPLPVIRSNILRVLDKLGVQYKEVKGGFVCCHSPVVDAAGNLVVGTAGGGAPSTPPMAGQSGADDMEPLELFSPAGKPAGHRRKFSLGSGLFLSRRKTQNSSVSGSGGEEAQLSLNTTDSDADQSTELVTGVGGSDMLVSSRIEQQHHGHERKSSTGGTAGSGTGHTGMQIHRTPVKFELYIVKIPVLGLYGVQLKKVTGNTWTYKALAGQILSQLNL